jgi:hypothetical protein
LVSLLVDHWLREVNGPQFFSAVVTKSGVIFILSAALGAKNSHVDPFASARLALK